MKNENPDSIIIYIVNNRINCFDTSGWEINRKLHCRFMNTAITDKSLFTKFNDFFSEV